MKVLILGAGRMVEAILEGLKNESDLSQFYIFSPSGTSAERLAKKVGVNYAASLDDVKDPKWVWIGCKPQQLHELAKSIKGKYPLATYLSMLAAIPEADQLKILGVSKLIRIMPNLPVRFKRGVTLMSSVSAKDELKLVKNLFSLVGLAKELEESELEELTLLTGSGPALFYEFTKMLAMSFTSLSMVEREKLARMTLTGAGLSSDMSGEDLTEMINGVTSKGGVTIAVLEEWRRLKLNEQIQKGVLSGKDRSNVITETLRHI
jgi:pyrroline-5-carboxylate reductase